MAGRLLRLPLGRFDTALGHFRRSATPFSAPSPWAAPGYWLGRTHEALGNEASRGGGLRAGRAVPVELLRPACAGTRRHCRSTRPSLPMRISAIGAGGVHDILGLPRRTSSIRSGERNLAERFLTHLTESLSRTEAGHARRLRAGTGDAHVALRIAKRAAQNGYEIMRAYYPITDLAEGDWPIDAALALSIARRESEFDPGVISHAGAMGLMQVMPGTGRDTAAALEIEYDQDRVLGDPEYNALLATSYIAGLNERFDGNVVLVSAGLQRRAAPGLGLDRTLRRSAGGGCRRHHLLDRGDPLHRDAQLHHARDRKPRRSTRRS
jgi:soluble lytic murein transglycosylase